MVSFQKNPLQYALNSLNLNLYYCTILVHPPSPTACYMCPPLSCGHIVLHHVPPTIVVCTAWGAGCVAGAYEGCAGFSEEVFKMVLQKINSQGFKF
jgi:hypothetical protein